MTDIPQSTNNPADGPYEGDPNLTAYALGELDPGSDVYKQVEAQLADDPDARAYVEQARALAEQLAESFRAADASAGLSEHQHQEISDMIDQQQPTTTQSEPEPRIFKLPRKVLLAAGLALAATAAITTVVLMNGPDKPVIVEELNKDKADHPLFSHPVKVDYDQTPLREVFADLQKKTDVPIEADWDALALRGVDADMAITMSSGGEEVPANNVLALALQYAWSGSPHPDPAQWAISDAGITVAPKSTLVQQRLDATAKLLADRRFSKTPYDDGLLNAGKAEVWESDLWNEIADKRAEAGKRVVEEAAAALDAAEKAEQEKDYDAASDHGLYAYQLLATHGAVLNADQFNDPVERIGKLERAIYDGRLQQDRAAIAQAVKAAEANNTELGEYDSAMAAASEALNEWSFQAAYDAVVKARAHLNKNRGDFKADELTRLSARAIRLQSEIQSTRYRVEGIENVKAEWKKSLAEGGEATEADQRKAAEIGERLAEARELQQKGEFAKASDKLDGVLVMDPDETATWGVQDQFAASGKDAEHSIRLGRTREVERLQRQLSALEKSIPQTESKLDRQGLQLQQQQRITGMTLGDKRNNSLGIREGVWFADGQVSGGGYAGKALTPRYANSIALKPGLASAPTGNRNGTFSLDALTDAKKAKSRGGRIDSYELASKMPAAHAPGLLTGEGITTRDSLLGTASQGQGAIGGYLYDEAEAREFSGRGLQRNLHWDFQQPQNEQPRRQRYEDQIKHYYKSIDLDDDNKLTEEQLQQVQVLKRGRDRAAVTEPLELKRIEAMKELRDLERRFVEDTRKDLTPERDMSRDAYAMVNDNPFKNAGEKDANGRYAQAISTFSVDVDTAAYSLVRRQLMQQRRLPVPGAIRIEEMINYFDYGYEAPIVDAKALEDGVVTQASLEKFEKDNEGFAPFTTDIQVTDCPWTAGNKLVRIGIQGMDVKQEDRPTAHLTFLLDVSGSMSSPNKLPLVKDSIKLLLDKLNDRDRISIVVYAGRTATVMENVSAKDRPRIEQALDQLKSGGSTAGAAGIQLAYEAAQKHFIDGGVNRVILCTDGDFNVGISDTDDLVALIKQKANPKADDDGKRRGVYLSVMGYGMGNLNDAMMEPLTNAGNGTYAYIDTLEEATKVMYDQAGSTLVAIAKDVKVQVHFDPTQVMAYRLIGYENRILATKDFDDDTVDAGDIGAGHSVTALYEVVPFGNDGLFDDGEEIREVRLQIDQLEEAIALNQSLMQTCSLNADESMKLAASTKLLEQELVFCQAVVEKFEPIGDTDPSIDPKAKAEDKPAPDAEVEDAPEGEAEPVDDRPEVELDAFEDNAMMSVRLRYKPVDAPAEDGTSRRIDERVFAADVIGFDQADESTRFAAAVAGFGMVLRSSPHAGNADLGWVLDTATNAMTHDPNQIRAEFIEIVGEAMTLTKPAEPKPADAPGAAR